VQDLVAYTDPGRRPANAPLAMTNDNLPPFSFPAIRGKKVAAAFLVAMTAPDVSLGVRRYLRELALQDVNRRIAGCFVAVADDGAIAGFYILAATSVPIEAVPVDLRRRLPYYPTAPAIVTGRLAVALERQGQGLGRAVIADAVIRTDRLSIGALALIVDAKDEAAAAFYRASGFQPIPDETRHLFLPIATALQALAGGE
jgi:GNAT superfamily N-acetyltransferase